MEMSTSNIWCARHKQYTNGHHILQLPTSTQNTIDDCMINTSCPEDIIWSQRISSVAEIEADRCTQSVHFDGLSITPQDFVQSASGVHVRPLLFRLSTADISHNIQEHDLRYTSWLWGWQTTLLHLHATAAGKYYIEVTCYCMRW